MEKGEREMKKSALNLNFIVSLVLALSLAAASARAFADAPSSTGFPGGGDGIPTPLNLTSNARVELASGEQYTLIGVIRNFGGSIYLEIDFDQHPWLATQNRLANPYYAVSSPRMNLNQWSSFMGRKVVLDTQARGLVQLKNARTAYYSLELTLVRGPELYTDYMNRSRAERR